MVEQTQGLCFCSHKTVSKHVNSESYWMQFGDETIWTQVTGSLPKTAIWKQTQVSYLYPPWQLVLLFLRVQEGQSCWAPRSCVHTWCPQSQGTVQGGHHTLVVAIATNLGCLRLHSLSDINHEHHEVNDLSPWNQGHTKNICNIKIVRIGRGKQQKTSNQATRINFFRSWTLVKELLLSLKINMNLEPSLCQSVYSLITQT